MKKTFWSTASFGDNPGTSPMELSALGDHVSLCKVLSGRLFPVQCQAEAMHRFVAGRFMTTLLVFSLFMGAVAWAA